MHLSVSLDNHTAKSQNPVPHSRPNPTAIQSTYTSFSIFFHLFFRGGKDMFEVARCEWKTTKHGDVIAVASVVERNKSFYFPIPPTTITISTLHLHHQPEMTSPGWSEMKFWQHNLESVCHRNRVTRLTSNLIRRSPLFNLTHTHGAQAVDESDELLRRISSAATSILEHQKWMEKLLRTPNFVSSFFL